METTWGTILLTSLDFYLSFSWFCCLRGTYLTESVQVRDVQHFLWNECISSHSHAFRCWVVSQHRMSRIVFCSVEVLAPSLILRYEVSEYGCLMIIFKRLFSTLTARNGPCVCEFVHERETCLCRHSGADEGISLIKGDMDSLRSSQLNFPDHVSQPTVQPHQTMSDILLYICCLGR